MTWLLALLGIASGQDEATVSAAATAQDGWEWWAAGGGAALLSGGGGTVLVRKVLSVLALEEKVDQHAKDVTRLNDALASIGPEISAIREAISNTDSRIDRLAATLAGVETTTASTATAMDEARKHREEFVELRTNVQHIADRFRASDAAIQEVRRIILEARRD